MNRLPRRSLREQILKALKRLADEPPLGKVPENTLVRVCYLLLLLPYPGTVLHIPLLPIQPLHQIKVDIAAMDIRSDDRWENEAMQKHKKITMNGKDKKR